MKIFDEKTKTTRVVFKEYKLDGKTTCPECGRAFKEYDVKFLEQNNSIRCSKCGAKLIK